MAILEAGTPVTYLSEFFNEKHWAYVEVLVSGVPMRGFIEADVVNLLTMEQDEPSYAPTEALDESEITASSEPIEIAF